MICPSCKCECRAGVTQCADCGVPLVDTLVQEPAAPLEHSGVVPVWAGNDPAECAAVKEALRKAEIPFVDQSSNAYFILRSMRPKTEICVPSMYEERARQILAGFQGSVDLDELTPEEIASLALPESNGGFLCGDMTIQEGIPGNFGIGEPDSQILNDELERFSHNPI